MANPLWYPGGKKGDEDKTADREAYRKNYDRIFGKKKEPKQNKKKEHSKS